MFYPRLSVCHSVILRAEGELTLPISPDLFLSGHNYVSDLAKMNNDSIIKRRKRKRPYERENRGVLIRDRMRNMNFQILFFLRLLWRAVVFCLQKKTFNFYTTKMMSLIFFLILSGGFLSMTYFMREIGN